MQFGVYVSFIFNPTLPFEPKIHMFIINGYYTKANACSPWNLCYHCHNFSDTGKHFLMPWKFFWSYEIFFLLWEYLWCCENFSEAVRIFPLLWEFLWCCENFSDAVGIFLLLWEFFWCIENFSGVVRTFFACCDNFFSKEAFFGKPCYAICA